MQTITFSADEIEPPPQAASGPISFSADEIEAPAPPKPRWSEPGGDVLLDVWRGAIKQPGRLVQMIPGVARATDALYGLPPGASKEAMQPANPTEAVGGYLADAVEFAASLGANGGMVYTRGADGKFTNAPYMSSVGGKVTQAARKTSTAVLKAIRAELGTKPLTTERVAEAAVRYGVKAVKAALIGLPGGYVLYKALK